MTVPAAPVSGSDYSKLVAGLQGGGSGAGLCTIVIWVLDVKGIQMPPEVAVAAASLLTAAFSAFGTWLKREEARA